MSTKSELPPHILLIEENVLLSNSFERFFKRAEIDYTTVSTCAQASMVVNDSMKLDLVIVSSNLEDRDQIYNFVTTLLQAIPNVKVWAHIVDPTDDSRERFIAAGCDKTFDEPVKIIEEAEKLLQIKLV